MDLLYLFIYLLICSAVLYYKFYLFVLIPEPRGAGYALPELLSPLQLGIIYASYKQLGGNLIYYFYSFALDWDVLCEARCGISHLWYIDTQKLSRRSSSERWGFKPRDIQSIPKRHSLKNIWGWRYASAVRSKYCPCTGPPVQFLVPTGTPAPGGIPASPVSAGTCTYLCGTRANMYTYALLKYSEFNWKKERTL